MRFRGTEPGRSSRFPAETCLPVTADPSGSVYTYRCTQVIGCSRSDGTARMQKQQLTFIGALAACAWLLSACGPMTIKDAATQTFVPIEGWVLELHQEVTIPPNRTRLFFQGGRVSNGINEYEPHCQLRVRPISTQPRPVHPDRFRIDKAFGEVDSIVSNGPVRLAAAGSAVVMGGGGDGDGPGQLIHFFYLGLHSERQPDVSYLVCGGPLNDPAFSRYPTLQEIRASLGDYATLVTAGDR